MVKLKEDRVIIYEKLESRIGNTSLEEYVGEVPNDNSIWIKRECDNPFGSHYDRVYLALYRHYEELEKIKPGDKVLETTSGTAGVSFSGIGKLLDYDCHVAIPEGVDKPVIDEIKDYGGIIYFTPEKDYISGFPDFLRDFLPRNRDFTFLNHSMGPRNGPAFTNNEVTLPALGQIAEEVLREIDVDYFVPAVGNGSSVLGPGRILKPNTEIVVFESFQSGVAYDQKFPGKYESEFGIKPGTLPKHKLRGTSYQGIDFPHIKNAIKNGFVDDVILVSDGEIDRNYHQLTGRNDSLLLPHWDVSIDGYDDLGKTTKAGLVIASEISKKVKDKNILVIAYDKAERYES